MRSGWPCSQNRKRASLGAGSTELLRLVEEPGASPAHGYSGLFHFALLVPDRASLGSWLTHAARDHVQLTGASDHNVSEALYLRDPDHHGIEIYSDRPRAQWEGRVADLMGTVPLDVEDVVSSASDAQRASFSGLPAGTRMGHVHLAVADVEPILEFYRDLLGFDLMSNPRTGRGLPRRGRVSPPPRREHLGEPRRPAGTRGGDGAASCATRSSCRTRSPSTRSPPSPAAASSKTPRATDCC